MTGPKLSLRVYHQGEPVFTTPLDEPIEIGRQRGGEPEPYCRIPATGRSRVIVAHRQEASVSRQHALIRPQADGTIWVGNISGASRITLDSGHLLEPGAGDEISAPATLTVGDRVIGLEQTETGLLELEGLGQPTLKPGGETAEQLGPLATFVADSHGGADPARLLRWLQSAMGVFESAASSPNFLAKAAQAVADMVGLDSAAVLRWDGAQWKLKALRAASGDEIPTDWRPSNTILERVRREKRTFRRVPQQSSDAAVSLVGVEALVASPILDAEGQVIGAIYGDRRSSTGTGSAVQITELEAMLVELLAFGVAAGLARLEQEQAALKARVQFEQFFTPELARQLESEPDLLAGKDVEISALFCDIRGFSRISERLGPARTVAWISDVMGVLSDCVIEHDGVLVDYIGDEIFAMWGAPVEQLGHETLACRAALGMIEQLAVLNHRWRDELGEPMGISIGINSGVARVGNMGSQRKFKYGPLGNTVNLASRVQGATKYAKSNVLITGETAAQLGAEFATRRLCRVRVVNIANPVDLYELTQEEDGRWLELKRRYESALRAYEDEELLSATRILGNLVADYPDDGPTQLLLSRAVNAVVHSDDEFDSVWNLSEK